jgi:hypothetical protein
VSPRQRSKSKRGWPAHLYERDGYYSWRHPETRKEFGLGRDRAAAFAEAAEANVHLAGLKDRTRLVDRLTGDSERSVSTWNAKYQELISKQSYAGNTLRSYKSLGKRMVELFGTDTAMAAVTPLMVSDALEVVAVTEGKARLAQALRNFMRDSFREARVKGWCKDNPGG